MTKDIQMWRRSGWRTAILLVLLAGFSAGARGQSSAGEYFPSGADQAFVPLDSWVYPALDRLSALGFIPSQIAGLRPWTRRECRRQLDEARRILQARQDLAAERALEIIAELERELVGAAGFLAVESLYIRNGAVAGGALSDSFHFGQTWRDDFGRPFGQGWNRIAGATLRFGHGPLFGQIRAEYQGAPGRPAYSAGVQQAIAVLDRNPVTSGALDPVNRLRLVEGEIGIHLGSWSLSAGRQSLFWGPSELSPLSFSTNAEPTANVKLSMDPRPLPGPLSRWVQVRGEFVVGKLGGHSYTWRPWFNAQKLSFKIGDNLELGFTRWSLMFGVGHPITWRNLGRNFGSVTSGQSGPFDPNDPGDRKGGFDFRWRIPGVRDWVTLYSDSYSEDDPSPLAAPRRAAISPGIWFARIPWIPQMDLRVEAASTQPLGPDQGGEFNYYNNQYHSGNTNFGFILGNPVGRDGRTIESRVNYWLTPRDRVLARFRQTKYSGHFLPGGGTQTSAELGTVLRMRPNWVVEAGVQWERYWIPLLGAPRTNWSGRLQLTWLPAGGHVIRQAHDRTKDEQATR